MGEISTGMGLDNKSVRLSNPYKTENYTPESNDRNTITIEGYFKLLAAQLAHQDMSNPMDNSEMLAQLTQMAMIKSIGTMTESAKVTQTLEERSYATSLIGKNICIEKEDKKGGILKIEGTVSSVNLTGDDPKIKIDGHNEYFSISELSEISSNKGNNEELSEDEDSDESMEKIEDIDN